MIVVLPLLSLMVYRIQSLQRREIKAAIPSVATIGVLLLGYAYKYQIMTHLCPTYENIHTCNYFTHVQTVVTRHFFPLPSKRACMVMRLHFDCAKRCLNIFILGGLEAKNRLWARLSCVWSWLEGSQWLESILECTLGPWLLHCYKQVLYKACCLKELEQCFWYHVYV